MKANSCGTVAEQSRYRMGFRLAKEVPVSPETAGKRCKNCRHIEEKLINTWRCRKGDFATRLNCSCNDFSTKEGTTK